MPKTLLNDAVLRSFPLPVKGQVDLWDASLESFGVRVSQGGSKTFLLKKHNRRITIGHYPLLSLAEARAEARRLLAEFTLGRIRPQSLTVSQARQLYLEEKGKNRRPRTIKEYKRLLEKHCDFPGQLSHVTTAQVTQKLSKLPKGEYNHALTAIKVFFNWCKKRRYITENPAEGISLHKLTPRSKVLTDAELVKIFRAAKGQFGNLIRLCMLLGQRPGEIHKSLPEWATADTLTIPAEVAKNGRESTIPLSTFAKKFFTAPFSPFQWGKEKRQLDTDSGVTGWQIRDLRRTLSTRLSEFGTPPHVVERILNHLTGTLSPIALVYNKATFLKEMREALGAFETHLSKLLESR